MDKGRAQDSRATAPGQGGTPSNQGRRDLARTRRRRARKARGNDAGARIDTTRLGTPARGREPGTATVRAVRRAVRPGPAGQGGQPSPSRSGALGSIRTGQGNNPGQSGQNSSQGQSQPGSGTPGEQPGTPGASQGGENPGAGTPSGSAGRPGNHTGSNAVRERAAVAPGRRPPAAVAPSRGARAALHLPMKPSPRPPRATPPQNADETVAPRNIPQSEFSLRNVQELLKDPEAAKKLQEATGLSPDQIEQFAKKLDKDKVPKAATRPGAGNPGQAGREPARRPQSRAPRHRSRHQHQHPEPPRRRRGRAGRRPQQYRDDAVRRSSRDPARVRSLQEHPLPLAHPQPQGDGSGSSPAPAGPASR